MQVDRAFWLNRVIAGGFIYLIVIGNLCLTYVLMARPLPSSLYVMMTTGLLIQTTLVLAAVVARIVAKLGG